MSGLANRTFTGMNVTTPIPTVLPEIPSGGGGPLPANGVFTNPAISVDNQGRIRFIEDAGGGGGGLSNITIGPGLEPTGLLADGSTLQVNYNAAAPNIITAAGPTAGPNPITTGAILIQKNPVDDVSKIDLINIGLSSFANLNSDLNMSNAFKVTNLPNPNVGSDAANKNYVDQAVITGGTLVFQGGYDASTNNPNITNPSPPGGAPGSNGISAGATYVVTTAGTISWPGGGATIVAEVGEVLIAGVDNPTTAADWVDVQRNTGLATEISTGICRFPNTAAQGLPPGDLPLSVSNGAVSLAQVNLASQVTGNLPVTNLDNGPPVGPPADANYFWCGNGTWNIPTPPVQARASYKIETRAAPAPGAAGRDVFAEQGGQVCVVNIPEIYDVSGLVAGQIPFISVGVAPGEYFVQFSGSLFISSGGPGDTMTLTFESLAGGVSSILNEMEGEYYDNDLGFPFSMSGIYRFSQPTRFFIRYTISDLVSSTAWNTGTSISLFKLT